MEYDFTSICDCGWESYAPTLLSAKKTATLHLDEHCKQTSARVVVGRNFRGGDIDDSFKDVVVLSTAHVHAINKKALDGFFAKHF